MSACAIDSGCCYHHYDYDHVVVVVVDDGQLPRCWLLWDSCINFEGHCRGEECGVGIRIMLPTWARGVAVPLLPLLRC